MVHLSNLISSLIGSLWLGWVIASSSSAQAQIIPDPTWPTTVTPNGTDTQIMGTVLSDPNAAGERNLLHRLLQLSVGQNQSVTFLNDIPAVRNVIVLVTDTASNIDGAIQSGGNSPNFNLFLLNPHGVTFTSTASISIQGSFVVSTASTAFFSNGTQFSATSTDDPKLMVNLPTGLVLGSGFAAIDTQGAILKLSSTNSNQTLAFLSNHLSLAGVSNLRVENGSIELASVAPNSVVGLVSTPQGIHLDLGKVQELGDIQFDQTFIETPGGQQQIQGRDITLQNSALSAEPSLLQDGGLINVHANRSLSLSTSQIITRSDTNIFNAGDIRLQSPQLTLQNSQISSSTRGLGQGGDIIIDTDTTVIRNSIIRSNSTTFVTGPAGNINLTARQLQVLEGGQILTNTQSISDGGRITIRPPSTVSPSNASVLISGSSPTTPSQIASDATFLGNAGSVDITTGNLRLDLGEISTKSSSLGGSGTIGITSNIVEMNNASQINAETQNSTGGNISFDGQTLIIMNCCNNTISARARGIANGGNISFNFNQSGGLIISPYPLTYNNDVIASAESGNGGQITIQNFLDITGSKEPYNFQDRLPPRTPESDFSARSISGQDGTVTLNIRDNLSSEQLPDDVMRPNQITRGCGTGNQIANSAIANSQFFLSGQGGLVTQPNQALEATSVDIPWIDISSALLNSPTNQSLHSIDLSTSYDFSLLMRCH